MGPDYQSGKFTLRMTERLLLADGVEVPLGGRAFDVLATLVQRAGKLVTKDELFERAWPGVVVEENNLQVQIRSLRKVLGPQSIAAVSGQGYRFTLKLDTNYEARLAQSITSIKQSMEEPVYDAIEKAGSELGYEEVLAEASAWLDSIRC